MPSRKGQVQFGSGQRNIDYSWKITCDVPKQTKLKESTDNALFLYQTGLPQEDVMLFFTFSHFHWLNVLWSWGSENTGVSVCLSVRLCVCVCVCLFAPVRRNYRADFNETFQNWSLVGLYVCVWVWLINIIDDVTAAILDEKTSALSRLQFLSDFLEIEI